jgi:hypothetical protein
MENESDHLGQNEMAGLKGKSGPPGNMNAFKHGLAAIQKRHEEGIPTEHEETIRQQILDGLIADKGGDEQVSTATRILAEVIASDASWLMVFNGAIDHIIQNNPKARQNPRGSPRETGLHKWALRHKVDETKICEVLLHLRGGAPGQTRLNETIP